MKRPVATCDESAQVIFDSPQAGQDSVVVILPGPCVARNPATAGILWSLRLRRVRVRGVVVDGAHDHATRPGGDSAQGCALEFSRFVSRFHVFHFAVLPIGDPCGEDVEFLEVADGRYAAELESSVARALLDASWKVGEQRGRCAAPKL